MKKTIMMLTFTAALVTYAAAAEFAPTLLRLNAPQVVGYDFDGSELTIPVMVEGTNAGILFAVFTKDFAVEIPNTVNGYLGWHQVNSIDTCVYYSPLKSVGIGEAEITWDGLDQDGGVVPAGEYTYYLWAFDNQGAKQSMCKYLNSGWGFDYKANVREKDENGLPLANPLWYTHTERWLIGCDPLDESLLETTLIQKDDGWGAYGEPIIDPRDISMVYLSVSNQDAEQGSIRKFRWVPNGTAEIVQNWGAGNGLAETFSKVGGGSPGIGTDGDYLFTGDENHVASVEPDAQFYIYDFDGVMVEEIDLSPWWSSAEDFEQGGQMNGGPNSMFSRNGFVFLNCHCNCLNQMVWPYRYLETGDYDDFFAWSNGNGDYTLDHNFEETAQLPWICNDYNVGPYKYSISADDNLFTAVNAYDVGAVSFGLLAPDGTGLGYYAFAGETAGWKKGTIFVDGDTPFDGIYCDNEQTMGPHYDMDRTKLDPGIFFIGHDTIKGVITTGGPIPELKPYVRINTPNGGEEIERGSTISISWSFRKIDYLKIEFSSDGGVTWNVIAGHAEASKRSYSWKTPGTPSDRCLVRVTDVSATDITDTSDREFSLFRPPTSQYYFTDVSNTGNHATLLVTTDNPPTLYGTPLETGDCIGVFTPRGLCAGAGVWEDTNLAITLWGDDSLTEGIRGFNAGEPLTFKVWDSSEDREYIVAAAYELGDGVFHTDGIYILSGIDINAAQFTLSLAAGWNTVSLPVSLADMSMNAILAPATDALVLVKNGRGNVWWPEYGIDTISNWRLTDGYQIYMNTPAVVAVEGFDVFSPDIVYTLPKDWSLIGYVGPEGASPDAALAGISDKLVVVKNGAGEVFWPEQEIDQIGSMRQGEGYWIYLTAPGSFTFPSSVPSKPAAKITASMPTQYFTCTVSTGGNATVLVRSETGAIADGIRLSTGDEIAFITESGFCAGAGVWEKEKSCVVAVWGDDEMTGAVDGYVPGESYRIVVWDADTGREYEAPVRFLSGGSRYERNGLAIAEISTDGTDIGSETVEPLAFRIAQNTPNPFNPSTSISFTLPHESRAMLTVYDVTGAKVATLTDGILTAGEHSVTWDASGFPSGVYFYRLRAGEFTGTGKMLLVK